MLKRTLGHGIVTLAYSYLVGTDATTEKAEAVTKVFFGGYSCSCQPCMNDSTHHSQSQVFSWVRIQAVEIHHFSSVLVDAASDTSFSNGHDLRWKPRVILTTNEHHKTPGI